MICGLSVLVQLMNLALKKFNEVLQNDLIQWENQVNEVVAQFAETTTDRQRVLGASSKIEMDELDELGRPVTRKSQIGSTVGFRLNRFGSAVGYTDLWLKSHTPAEMVENQLKVQRGHQERIMKEIKKAIYVKDNETFVDWLVDNVSLGVKGFANNDGTQYPESPSGEVFATTHNHYTNRAGGALAAGDIDSCVDLVAEHGFGGIVLYVALADVPAISALAQFTPLSAPMMDYNVSDVTAQKLDVTANPSHRLVGYWGSGNWFRFIPVNGLLPITLPALP